MKKVFILMALFSAFSLHAKDLKSNDVLLEKLVTEEDEVIWGFTFLNDDEVLISLRSGNLIHHNLKLKTRKVVPTPAVHAYGQGGLLDVQKFKIKGEDRVYITYSSRVDGVKTTSLAMATLSNGKVGPFKNIFNARVKSSTNRHYGSRIAYDGESLYMTVGDRGERQFSQDLNLHNGKILRLTPEGKAASNNPFVAKGLPEIWSLGHRNPQGIFFDRSTKKLFSCEFGPRGGDELNLVERGKNYGWPVITYGREYYGPKIGTTKKEGMEQPLTHWVPSISPSGMTIYQGNKVKSWRGDVFLANLSSNHIRRVRLEGSKVIEQQKILEDLQERIRHISNGPQGHLYFSTDSGLLYKIKGLAEKRL